MGGSDEFFQDGSVHGRMIDQNLMELDVGSYRTNFKYLLGRHALGKNVEQVTLNTVLR